MKAKRDLDALRQQIGARLMASDERRQMMQVSLQQTMEEMEQRSQLFVETATRLFESVILPRVEILKSFFRKADLQRDIPGHPLYCVCRFEHNEDFPASTKLTLSIDPGEKMRKIVISYSSEILPIFFQFEGHDQEAFDVDPTIADRVTQWADKKILDFLDTYTQLQHVDQYQRDNLVVDPVCGMRFNKVIAPVRAEHATVPGEPLGVLARSKELNDTMTSTRCAAVICVHSTGEANRRRDAFHAACASPGDSGDTEETIFTLTDS